MFGSPSLSLTFSWAAPLESSQTDFHSPPLKKLASDSELTTEDIAADEGELLGKPFELTLARYLPHLYLHPTNIFARPQVCFFQELIRSVVILVLLPSLVHRV